MVVTNEVQGKQVTGLKGNYDHLFNLISTSGYQGVELLIKNPFLVDFKEIKRLLNKYNLELSVICTGEVYGEDGLSFGDTDPNVRKEAVKRTIEVMKIAEEFNANVNVGRLRGKFTDEVKKEDTINWSKEGFLKCAESNENVNLLLEPINHKVSNFILTTEQGVQFIKELNKTNIRLMLDYIHMAIENEDFENSIKVSEGYFDHIHVCDSDRKPLGLGGYNIKHFADLVVDTGYDGYVSIEAFDTNEYESYIKNSLSILQNAFMGTNKIY
jgi:sugar phosphate isomerase/epimerase